MAAHVHLVPEVHHSGKQPPVIFFFLSLLAGIALKFISKRLISPVPYTTYLLLVGIVSRYDTMIDNGAISSEGKKNDGAVLKAKNVRNLVERDDRDAARARRARNNEMALACRGGPVGVPHGEVEARPPVGRRFKLFGREIPTWTGWVLIAVVVAFSVILYLKFTAPTANPCIPDFKFVYDPKHPNAKKGQKDLGKYYDNTFPLKSVIKSFESADKSHGCISKNQYTKIKSWIDADNHATNFAFTEILQGTNMTGKLYLAISRSGDDLYKVRYCLCPESSERSM
eukprot:431608_1